ncbi:MAG: LysR family transcriptional regulator [Bacteriovoracaceae bacterium]
MIETSQLQTLVAVAKTGSFSSAAHELHVTQSAISQSIKTLETKVGVTLFNRSGKKVGLTLEGEKLYKYAKEFLSKLEDTLHIIKLQKDEMEGLIRVGTLTGVGKSWIAPQLVEFSALYPKLNVSISLAHDYKLVEEFENFQLDLLLLPEYSLPNSGEKVLLGEEFAQLVYPKGSDYEFLQKDLSLENLQKCPLILFEKNDPLFNKWCIDHFKEIPKELNKRLVVNSHGNMLYAVAKGLGVAVVPTHVLNRSYYKEQVVTALPSREKLITKFYFVYHKESLEIERMKKLIAYVKKNFNANVRTHWK